MTVKTDRGNITTTKAILNELSLFLYEAENSLKGRGRKHLAERANELAELLYNSLEDNGYYN